MRSLSALAAEVVRAAPSPLPESTLKRTLEVTLNEAFADYHPLEIREAIASLSFVWDIERDTAGRLYSTEARADIFAVSAHVRRSQALATHIADIEVDDARYERGRTYAHRPHVPSSWRDLRVTSVQREVGKEIERGNRRALEELVLANIGLVASATTRLRRFTGPGLDLDDLFQEGCIGLIRAAEKFDWRLGYRFSTYATWWIRQAHSRAVADKSRSIRLPVHIAEKLQRIHSAERALDRKGVFTPSQSQVAMEAGLPVSEVDHVRGIEAEVVDICSARSETSWPQAIDWHERGFDDVLDREMVVQLLGKLTERERSVLEMHFGLENGAERTLDEIGRQFGVTRERIRQIEAEALRKLRDVAAPA
jgi:RNA polymerase sigma factor (sigma-70 family)